MTMSYDVAAEIQRLKKEKNAVVLAHYYEDGDIQDVADYVGDSFFLAKKGQEVKEQVILLAGVVFMAESVKIMNPTKTVLVPELEATCSLVKGAPYDKYLAWRQQHREGIAVTYINSSAEVKSISDVIITSSNAAQIVESIPKDRKILFGPDQHLGRWLSKKLNREMEFWNGSCEVHVLFNANRLAALIKEHPDALILAHPECDDSVLAYANIIGSTQHLLDSVSSQPHKKFIVATETGIFHQMQKRRPDATFIQAPVVDEGCKCNDCPYMKMNNMEKIKRALETLKPEVNLPEALRLEAKVSLDRMMDITSGKAVQWPSQFNL
ncbi:quinolinate synthase NadA [Bdellovibrio sp. HCB274]|uniref:quinolinate synthase NadA n=1 Tax=Bdellovibrio sp. HCB274 TaxID=3394361 RepID=UPI0039B67FCB